MPRKKKKHKLITCPSCGYSFAPTQIEPIKTWHLVSPMPDKQGRITVTIMAVWECPQCGRKIRGTISKIKIGEDSERKVDRTQMLIDELTRHERISLYDLSQKFKFGIDTIRMAVKYLIEKGLVKGRVENDVFIKE